MSAMEIIEIVMKILGGMGCFLMGTKILSENLTKLAHSKLNSMLNKTEKSRIAGVGIGAVVTIIGHSSAFTTVMVVGLVNAGIMTLFQATACIMGANIGTTLNAWVISLSGFSGGGFNVMVFMFCLTAVGAFMTMFSKKERVKSIGNALAGFGLIFVGLEFMSSAMSFDEGTPAFEAVSGILNKVTNPVVLLLIGVVVTAIVQSSTAVTSIILSMAMATPPLIIGGGGNAALYVIIGSNIGTCVTALISSIGAAPNAKRAAVIHFLFNFFGAIIFMIVLVLWPSFTANVLEKLFPSNKAMQIAMFHTLFNVINAAIFLPFIKGFVWIANRLVPERKAQKQAESGEKPAFGELDERLLRSPSVALGYMYQQTGKLFSFAVDTLAVSVDGFLNKDMGMAETVFAKNNELTEANKTEVANLVKISAASLVMEDERTVSNLHYVLNDIMRIGELADNVTKYTRHYVNDELEFSDEFLTMLQEMHAKIQKLYELSLAVFLNKNKGGLKEVDRLEDEIDRDRRRLVDKHIKRLNEGRCQPQNSSVFINLVGNLERAADHITYIAHSVE